MGFSIWSCVDYYYSWFICIKTSSISRPVTPTLAVVAGISLQNSVYIACFPSLTEPKAAYNKLKGNQITGKKYNLNIQNLSARTNCILNQNPVDQLSRPQSRNRRAKGQDPFGCCPSAYTQQLTTPGHTWTYIPETERANRFSKDVAVGSSVPPSLPSLQIHCFKCKIVLYFLLPSNIGNI